MTEKLTVPVERALSLLGAALTVAGPVLAMVIYFAQIGPTLTEQANRIADLRAGQAEQRGRLDRIDEGRAQGLQRLSAVEEAVKASKIAVEQINAKLDRLLFDRRR